MTRNLGFILALLAVSTPSHSDTQGIGQSLPETNLTTTRMEYTDAELGGYGFTPSELATYKVRMQTRAGRWWGQLSPMEMMMYSAVTEVERKRFARMYLETMHPKSIAERDAATAMYVVARDLYQETQGIIQFSDQRTPVLERPILFVNMGCVECKQDVIELVTSSNEVLDIYVSGLSGAGDFREQLISWARSMRLPPAQITLNEDRGIYQRRYGKPLDKLHLVHQ